jgi:hypothetical protein
MERFDLAFFTARASLIVGALCGLLLLLCPIAARCKNDATYYKLFLICAPVYTAYMILYALPLEAVAQLGLSSAVELQIVDDFYGPTRGIVLPFISIPILIVAVVYSLWVAVKRSHDGLQRRSTVQYRSRPIIQHRHKHIDDNPYQEICESSNYDYE